MTKITQLLNSVHSLQLESRQKFNLCTFLPNIIKFSEKKRFQEFTEEEIAIKRQKVQNKNTQNSDKSTTKQFCMYLEQHNLNVNFWEMSPEELDPVLGTI